MKEEVDDPHGSILTNKSMDASPKFSEKQNKRRRGFFDKLEVWLNKILCILKFYATKTTLASPLLTHSYDPIDKL
jgi:hypothetical protein